MTLECTCDVAGTQNLLGGRRLQTTYYGAIIEAIEVVFLTLSDEDQQTLLTDPIDLTDPVFAPAYASLGITAAEVDVTETFTEALLETLLAPAPPPPPPCYSECTVYRDGATATSPILCLKAEWINGNYGTVCRLPQGVGNALNYVDTSSTSKVCPSDMTQCATPVVPVPDPALVQCTDLKDKRGKYRKKKCKKKIAKKREKKQEKKCLKKKWGKKCKQTCCNAGHTKYVYNTAEAPPPPPAWG